MSNKISAHPAVANPMRRALIIGALGVVYGDTTPSLAGLLKSARGGVAAGAETGASISSLIPSVSCRRCSPNAPFAKLEMLTAERP